MKLDCYNCGVEFTVNRAKKISSYKNITEDMVFESGYGWHYYCPACKQWGELFTDNEGTPLDYEEV